MLPGTRDCRCSSSPPTPRASTGPRCAPWPGEFTSSTFYDDVRVPASNLVGEENQGWTLITNQLNHERVAICPVSGSSAASPTSSVGPGERLADGRRVIDQEWVRVHLARLAARADYLKLLNWKVAWASGQGLNPADASATKVYGTEFALEAYRLLLEIVGQAGYLPEGSPGAVLRGRSNSSPAARPSSPSVAGPTRSSGTSSPWSAWACPGLPASQPAPSRRLHPSIRRCRGQRPVLRPAR